MHIELLKFQEEDFDYYFSLVSNLEVMAQITERAIPLEEAQINYRKLIGRNEKYEAFGSYKVFDSATNDFIGLGHLTLNEENKDRAEIGYMILPHHWGKGYGNAIAKALMEKAEKTELKTLKAIIDPQNIPSRRILIKHGFCSEQICEMDGLPAEILSKNL